MTRDTYYVFCMPLKGVRLLWLMSVYSEEAAAAARMTETASATS